MKKIGWLLFPSLLVLIVLGSCQDQGKENSGDKENPIIDAVINKEIREIYGEHQKKGDYSYIVCKATTSDYTEAYVVTYKQKQGNYDGEVNIVRDGDSYDTKVGGKFTVDENSCEEQK